MLQESDFNFLLEKGLLWTSASSQGTTQWDDYNFTARAEIFSGITWEIYSLSYGWYKRECT